MSSRKVHYKTLKDPLHYVVYWETPNKRKEEIYTMTCGTLYVQPVPEIKVDSILVTGSGQFDIPWGNHKDPRLSRRIIRAFKHLKSINVIPATAQIYEGPKDENKE